MKFKLALESLTKHPQVKVGVVVALGINNEKNELTSFCQDLSQKYPLSISGEDLDKIKGDLVLKAGDGEGGQFGFSSLTRSATIVIEALPGVIEGELRAALEELASFLADKLGGEIRGAVLGRAKPEWEIDYPPGGKTKSANQSEPSKKKKKTGKRLQKASISGIPALLQTDYFPLLQSRLLAEVKKAVLALGLDDSGLCLEHPADFKFGDYSTNFALAGYGRIKNKKKKIKSPLDLAEQLKSQILNLKSPLIGRVETAPPGYLNLWFKKNALISQLGLVLTDREKYPRLDFLTGKKILLEHTSPDPIKTIHIGHLRNNFIGMSVGRILTKLGAEVILDCINNDRGTHVCRAMLGYLIFGRKSVGLDPEALKTFAIGDEKVKMVSQKANWRELLDGWLAGPDEWWGPEDWSLKPDHQNLIFYALGDRAERLTPELGEQVREILRDWEAEKSKVWALWRQIIDWSLSGYRQTYERIESHHDKVWHESELFQGGKELVRIGLEKGIFKESHKAIISQLAEYGLPDTVVIKSDKTALYHTFDLNLVLQKRKIFPADLYIWDIGSDQLLYLKQLFAMCEQLGIGQRESFFHLNYGYVSLASGEKMASRKGTVIKADDLIDLLKNKARQIMQTAEKGEKSISGTEKDWIIEKVALAAIKYGLLKTYRINNIRFDPDRSVDLKGDSGPYLQYTYARCQSILKKALIQRIIFSETELLSVISSAGGVMPLSRAFPGRSAFPFPGSSPARSGMRNQGFSLPQNFPGQVGSQSGGKNYLPGSGAGSGFSQSLPARFPPPRAGSLSSPAPLAGVQNRPNSSFGRTQTPVAPGFSRQTSYNPTGYNSGLSRNWPRGLSGSPLPGKKPVWLTKLSSQEELLLRTLYRFEEVVLEAGQKMDPSLICHFLLDLAQKFNLFYHRCPILKSANSNNNDPGLADISDPGSGRLVRLTNGREKTIFEQKRTKDDGLSRRGLPKKRQAIDPGLQKFRLALTGGVAQVLKNGLELLGIEALERM
ncbi:MAG: arginine--tRNA ligase [Candidatus Pacebacteria bacterium]|nr:arginine--tRNA ligase [Candidatus Paceibacterota bacterium]